VKLGRITVGMATLLVALAFAGSASAVTITEFPSNPGKESLPEKIVSGPGGNLWWTESGSEPGIGRISPTGELFPVIRSSVQPVDLVAAPSGWVTWVGKTGIGSRSPEGYVRTFSSEFIGGAITLTTAGALRMGGDKNSTAWTLLAPSPASSDHVESSVFDEGINARFGSKIEALAASAPNTLWASLSKSNQVLIMTASPLDDEEVSVDLPAGSNPHGIAIGPEGDAWVAMYDANAIDRIAPDGTRTRFALPANSHPYDLVLGPDGAFWILEEGIAKIGRMTTAGVVTNEYAVPSGETGQSGITVGPEGNIWFTDTEMSEIGRLVPDPIVSAGGGGSGAGGGGGNNTAPPPAADTTAPRFTAAPAFVPSRFAVAAKGKKSSSASAHVGSKLTFSLSEAASVTVTLTMKAPGRLAGKKCAAPGKAKPGAKKCDRQLAKGTLPLSGASGANQFAFSGTVGGKQLAAGSYQASLVARDPAGNASAPATASFTVVPPHSGRAGS
jgi:streptogramin lyase